jgi:hypothetical protein
LFRGQQTRHADWVWLASYHLTGVAQQWYLVLEGDCGRPPWEEFRRLYHQRFGPPLSTNHLSDLARLPFTLMVNAYMEAFQARTTHAGTLSVLQKAQLFTGGLPDHIRIDVELHEPSNLQHAMRLVHAYERHNAPALLALPAPPQLARCHAGALPAPTIAATAAGMASLAASSSSNPS